MGRPSVNRLAAEYRSGCLTRFEFVLRVFQASLHDNDAFPDTLSAEAVACVKEAATAELSLLHPEADGLPVGFVTPEAPVTLQLIPRDFLQRMVGMK